MTQVKSGLAWLLLVVLLAFGQCSCAQQNPTTATTDDGEAESRIRDDDPPEHLRAGKAKCGACGGFESNK